MAQVRQLITGISQKVRQCNRTTLQYAYVRAARQFCGETRWRRTTLQAILVVGQQQYDLGTDALEEIVDVPYGSCTQLNNGVPGTICPIVPIPPTSINPNLGPGQPLVYSYIPEAQIAFGQVPDQAYPVTLTLVSQPRNGVEEIPDELITKWNLAFEAGALEYLYSIAGEPWYSDSESRKYGQIFRNYINNAKADVARGYQSGSVRARPRTWVV